MLRSTLARPAFVGRVAARAASTSLRQASKAPTTWLPAFVLRAEVRSFPWLSVSLSQPRRVYSTEAEAVNAVTDTPAQSERITRFSDLRKLGVHQVLVNAITQGMKYENMTDVQTLTINPALAGKDLVAQAKTGTGKTLAFLVPIVQQILQSDPSLAGSGMGGGYRRTRADDIRAIIVSPTRELAEQIGVEAKKLVAGTGIVVQTAVGGTQKREMLSRTRREGCHLLVATPGRLNDLLSDKMSGIAAPKLAALVLDEADRMLDVGFDQELREILRYLPDRSQVSRQTLLFSATIPRDVVKLARSYVDPQNFEFCQTISADETPTHERVPQHVVATQGMENLFPTLLELLTREHQRSKTDENAIPLKAIVYMPTTSLVQLAEGMFDRLAEKHRLPMVSGIHSKLGQPQRTRAAEDFRAAKEAILISSDVTARGMDFPNVSHVIQIHLPPDREQYIHRIGRTGRANKPGQGWLIITESELGPARSRLPGLPIKRHEDLASAKIDMDKSPAEQRSEFFTDVQAVGKRLPAWLKKEAYTSYFGGASRGVNKMLLAEELFKFSIHTLGLPEPPALSHKKAVNLGLAKSPSIRIEDQDSLQDRRRDGGGSFSSGSRYAGGDDPFGSMERGGREGFGSRRGSEGGFGGGRSGGGGFGGGRGGGRGGGGYGRDRGSGYGDRQRGGSFTSQY